MTNAYRILVTLAFIFATPTLAFAQRWQVDPTPPAPGPNSTILMDAETYADTCDNNTAHPGNCVTRPGNADRLGLCPPYTWPAGIGWAPYPQWVTDRKPSATMLFPNQSFFGPMKDWGGSIASVSDDSTLIFPVTETKSTATSFVTLDGVGSRNLEIIAVTQTQNSSNDDDDFYARGCANLSANLSLQVTNPPQRTYFVRYDWTAIGSADVAHECMTDITGKCNARGLPAMEDPASAFCSATVTINGMAATLVGGAWLDNVTPGGQSVYSTPMNFGVVPVLNGGAISASLSVVQQASLTLQDPVKETADSSFRITMNLYLINTNFSVDPGYLRQIPPTGVVGEGPQYCIQVGRYEITNQQYADFLNSAELDAGATGLSSNMVFAADGSVSLPDGTSLIKTANATAGACIRYTAAAPIGARYTVDAPSGADPRSYGDHPVVFVSWYGALKYCNWATINSGLPSAQRCYSEGSNAADWHPVTITTGDWAARDLSNAERLSLVNNYAGFRLPMDNLGTVIGFVPNQANAYNEWYKAAAFDPAAPTTMRTGPVGEPIPPYHWTYGFGRDSIGAGDANFNNSTDPFDNDDAFVGLYTGFKYNPGNVGDVGNKQEFQSNADTNPWGLYDMSGNVSEWCQDQANLTTRAVRGGSWAQSSSFLAADRRERAAATAYNANMGFRIVRSCNTSICLTCPGDLNGDGLVDSRDIQSFIKCWTGGSATTSGCQCADMNGDGVLDSTDLALLVARLLTGVSSACP